MGGNASKPIPEPSHVWKSETPVRFSNELLDSLQSSTETDSTRAKTLELHIQSRVAEELKKLQSKSDAAFKDLTEKLSSEEPTQPKSAGDTLRDLGRESVQKDVESLRKKLGARKKVADIGELDAGVEKARNEVVKCLTGNDRRPLDCWQEVETFREEVKRMEGAWVEKIVR